MIEYLAFELCKSDERSRFLSIRQNKDGADVQIGDGRRGMYIAGQVIRYKLSLDDFRKISHAIEELKVYAWPKSIPKDYLPGEHLLGCDVGWSLEYKEKDKVTMRHIYGKEAPPKKYPYSILMLCINKLYVDPRDSKFCFLHWVYDIEKN